MQYANRYVVVPDELNRLVQIGFIGGGGYVITDSADGTPDGHVAPGAQVSVGGTPFVYHGPAINDIDGIIVRSTDGSNFYLLTNAWLGPNSVVGSVAQGTRDLIVCFVAGTRIATPEGERPIETIAIGDRITLASGEAKPVRWVGRQTVRLQEFNRRVASPVLIRAGALGDGLPRRDLYTSYRHGFALDGALVIAGVLVNGTSIVQCADWPEELVTYYQLEVDGHELMLAEGAPCETFGEDGDNRALFDNVDEYRLLYPDARPVEPMALGRVVVQRQLPRAVKERVAAAAAERARRVA